MMKFVILSVVVVALAYADDGKVEDCDRESYKKSPFGQCLLKCNQQGSPKPKRSADGAEGTDGATPKRDGSRGGGNPCHKDCWALAEFCQNKSVNLDKIIQQQVFLINNTEKATKFTEQAQIECAADKLAKKPEERPARPGASTDRPHNPDEILCAKTIHCVSLLTNNYCKINNHGSENRTLTKSEHHDQPKPAPKGGETKGEAKPAPAKAESKPAQTKGEAKPAQTKPEPAKPAQTKPEQPKSGQPPKDSPKTAA